MKFNDLEALLVYCECGRTMKVIGVLLVLSIDVVHGLVEVYHS